jgi:hypothetical protein
MGQRRFWIHAEGALFSPACCSPWGVERSSAALRIVLCSSLRLAPTVQSHRARHFAERTPKLVRSLSLDRLHQGCEWGLYLPRKRPLARPPVCPPARPPARHRRIKRRSVPGAVSKWALSLNCPCILLYCDVCVRLLAAPTCRSVGTLCTSRGRGGGLVEYPLYGKFPTSI